MKNKTLSSLKRKQFLFYIAIVAFPVVWSLFGFVWNNGRTVLYWFQGYDATSGAYYFNGIQNFIQVGKDIVHATWIKTALKNGIIGSSIGVGFGTITLLVPYYVFKNYFGSQTFKILLYYPQIISSMVLIVIFKFFVDQAYPALIEAITGVKPYGLLMNLDTQLGTLIFFTQFFTLGNGVIINTSIMANTSPELIEAAKMDGAGDLRQFWHVIIPAMYPTLVLSWMGIFTGVFSVNFYVFSFYGLNAESNLMTISYYMTKIVMGARTESYPYVATMGAYITAIVTPITLLTRKYLIKFGPSED